MIQLVVSGQMGILGNMSQANLLEMYGIGLLLAGLAYYKHWDNIKRLASGTERKTFLFKKKDVSVAEK